MVRPSRSLSANEYAVVSRLFDRGRATKPDLARHVGLSKPAIGELIGRLETAGVVHEDGESDEQRRGPNARQYGAVPGLGVVAGVEVQPGAGRACITDITGTVIGEGEHRAAPDASPFELAAGAVRAAAASAGLDAGTLDLVVVGMPGVISPDGKIAFVYGHPGWSGGNHRDLADELGCEVMLENDLNLAVLAEHRLGNGLGTDSLALVRCGGIGAAFIVGGRLVRGAHGHAGELGLAPLARDGLGLHTTQQELVTQEAYAEVLRELGVDGADLTEMRRMLARPRKRTDADDAFLAEVAGRVALMCLTVCAVLDPQRILLTGPFAEAGGERLVDAVADRIAASSPLRTDVRPAAFGERAVVAGALLAGLDGLRATVYGEAAHGTPAPVRLPEHWWNRLPRST